MNTPNDNQKVTLPLSQRQINYLRRGLFILRGQLTQNGNVSKANLSEVEELGNLLAAAAPTPPERTSATA